MKITHVEIEKFRSIGKKLSFDTSSLSVFCGINSCGKSNVLRALKFAFLPQYDPERMSDNIWYGVTSPNAECKIQITFDQPLPELTTALMLPTSTAFTYEIKVKRNGSFKSKLNGSPLSDSKREILLNSILLIYVPPIRDIAGEGLLPFKTTLAEVLHRSRGTDSFPDLNSKVKSAIEKRGKKLLDGTKSVAKEMLGVDELIVDTSDIEIEKLLPTSGVKIKVDGKELGLDKLGTGHQSSVILKMYRQLGEQTDKFVLYLFEEPDNHLHPTSMKALSEDLVQCSEENNSNVFITTHSPHLLNQFSFKDMIPLSNTEDRQTIIRKMNVTRSDREIRIALGKYGLVLPEALLANKIIVVEGANDVTIIRALINLKSGVSADRQDIMVVPAGGKGAVVDLSGLLQEMDVEWKAVFDWDATEATHQPMFKRGLTVAEISNLISAANSIKTKLQGLPTKDTKTQKSVDAILKELASYPIARPAFRDSTLDKFLRNHSFLNASQASILDAAIRRRQVTKANSILKQKNIWLWGGAIEEAIIRNSAAEAVVENLLITKGEISAAYPSSNRRKPLLGKLHRLAHEPELVTEIVETLWHVGSFNHSSVKSALNFLLE